MKILFILTNYPGFGGIEKVTQYLASYLVTKGYDISILSFGTNASFLLSVLDPSIRVDYVPQKAVYRSKKNTEYINLYLNRNNFDFVVLQDSYAPIEHIFRDVKYPWKEKLIVVEHNSPMSAFLPVLNKITFKNSIVSLVKSFVSYFSNELRKLKRECRQRKRHSFLLCNCRQYILLCEAFRNEMKYITSHRKNVWSKCAAKIRIITNPLTISFPNKSYLHLKKKQILFVGRLVEQKGVEFLLLIWKEFSLRSNNGWELIILGDGPKLDYIKSYILRENLQNIRIDAPSIEVEHYYEEASILVMTSIFEGFGLVLTEAMSRQCVPIAFSSYKAVFDIIDNKKNGILIQPFDIKDYVQQLLYLTANNELLAKMSQEAQTSISKFSIEKIGDSWIKMFSGL